VTLLFHVVTIKIHTHNLTPLTLKPLSEKQLISKQIYKTSYSFKASFLFYFIYQHFILIANSTLVFKNKTTNKRSSPDDTFGHVVEYLYTKAANYTDELSLVQYICSTKLDCTEIRNNTFAIKQRIIDFDTVLYVHNFLPQSLPSGRFSTFIGTFIILSSCLCAPTVPQ